nr:30S ribosomal protein S18 [Poropsis sp. ID1_4]
MLRAKYKNISKEINYKNLLLLYRYIKISGKIVPRRLNDLTTKRQRQISKAIKNARLMSFIPFFCGIRK